MSEGIEDHQRYVVKAGMKGFLGGLALSLPASYALHRRWPYYRALPPSLKVMGVIGIAVPAFAIYAEQASLEYNRLHWKDAGKAELDAQASREQARLQSLNQSDRLKEWAKRHQYGIIGGSWATSMGIATAIVMRDRQQTFSQKIVQARMWAQGLTVLILIAAGVLTHQDRQRRLEELEHRNSTVDHSWADIVSISEQNKKAKKPENQKHN